MNFSILFILVTRSAVVNYKEHSCSVRSINNKHPLFIDTVTGMDGLIFSWAYSLVPEGHRAHLPN